MILVVGAGILIGLFRFNYYTHHNWDDYLLTNIAALLLVPMMLILLVFRKEPSEFGFGVGDPRRGYFLAGVFFLLLLPLMIFAATRSEYQRYYPLDPRATYNLAGLCRFELVYGVYLFCWEFFFRGFLLFGLGRWLGFWSVFVQAAAFGIMHWGKPEFLPSFFSGVILGILALRSRSFMPCFVLHWAISMTFDIFIIVAKGGFIT
jgi:uncharacterized protein